MLHTEAAVAANISGRTSSRIKWASEDAIEDAILSAFGIDAGERLNHDFLDKAGHLSIEEASEFHHLKEILGIFAELGVIQKPEHELPPLLGTGHAKQLDKDLLVFADDGMIHNTHQA